MKKHIAVILSSLLLFTAVGCSAEAAQTNTETVITSESTKVQEVITSNEVEESTVEENTAQANEYFTKRDLEQTVDLNDARTMNLKSNKSYNIDAEGIYVLTGDVTETTINVEVDDESKVQLVLDNLKVVNKDMPVINVVSDDKVFITTTESENHLEVTGTSDLDAVIFSKSDLVLNGLGTLDIISNKVNGITSKDDLKITGGTYNIEADLDGLEANDSVRISGGTMNITSGKDGIHSENDDDASLGYIIITGGTINITAEDDGIHGNSFVQIDDGNITIENSYEGIEATYILINGGEFDIYSKDDGINATSLSDYDVKIEINGGDIKVEVGTGDTDGLDANGDIVINGGTVDVTGGSTFDADGSATLNGGTVIVNGSEVSELPASKGGRRGKGN